MKVTKTLASVLVVALTLLLSPGGVSYAAPMSTAFIYQERLMDGEVPVNGIYDLVFALCETPEGPSVLDAIAIDDVEIFDGFFTVELDFGPDGFDGNERWLQIEMRPGESIDPDAWVVHHPRLLIRPVPYAICALKGSGSGSADNDWMVSGSNMYAIPPGNVGIGTTSPTAPLDVRKSAQGTNVVTGLFTNPSDAADSAVSLELAVGTAMPTAWRIKASSHNMLLTNATVAYPAIGISSSNHVGMSNGLTVSSSSEPAIYSSVGTVPMILITGKHGLVSFGEDCGVYAWGGKQAGYFEGDVEVTGKLGIGTNNPLSKLHVYGGTLIRGDNAGVYIGPETNSVGLSYGTSSGSFTNLRLYWGKTCFIGNVGIGTNDPSESLDVTGAANLNKGVPSGIALRVNGDEALWYNDDYFSWGFGGKANYFARNVGIGTTGPAFLLHVNGNAGKPGGGSWANASDVRLKKNIYHLNGTLDKLLQLRGVTFEYKEPEKINELPGVQMGMIAQEVEKVFPHWVDTNADGFKTVTFRGFEALAVEALRQLREEKDAEIVRLQGQISELTARLEQLEAMMAKPAIKEIYRAIN